LFWLFLAHCDASLLLDRTSALLAGTDGSVISKNLVFDPRVFPAVLADQSDVGQIDRRFFLDNSTLDVSLGIGAGMPFNDLNTLDYDFSHRRLHDQNPPCFSTILATEHINLVVLLV
jgi:hypothetical protein